MDVVVWKDAYYLLGHAAKLSDHRQASREIERSAAESQPTGPSALGRGHVLWHGGVSGRTAMTGSHYREPRLQSTRIRKAAPRRPARA